MHFADKVGAQKLQVSAVSDNRALIKPRAGMAYVPLRQVSEQGKAAADYLAGRYTSPADLTIGFAALLDQLVPDPDPAAVPSFEQAMADLGEHIGFQAQRPEREIGNGPDVLWLLGDLAFLVIECKSGATTDTISRHDIAQLSHSVDWFDSVYDSSVTVTPVLVHPSRQLDAAATARAGTRVITFDRFALLREAVQRFGTSVAAHRKYTDATAVAERLSVEHLNGKAFVSHWGQSTRDGKRR